jgi:hypothetical protein
MRRLGSLTCPRLVNLNLLSFFAFHFTHDDHRRKVRSINRRMMKKSRTLIGQRKADGFNFQRYFPY